ncbi:UNVERIFIED_CONTAM: hypothetical protein GTU68_057292 [Idotea baltica]|nr:hypothetical protein [Idotea baltica]
MEADVPKDPIMLFREWFDAAISSDVLEANAMNIATVNKAGRPSSRIVLLKEVMDGGFVFYTNYRSRKAQDLVRIEGEVSKISRAQSEEYFHSRPYGSQIGSYTSQQSSVVSDRTLLEKRYESNFKQYEVEGKAPLPEDWGGYILKPDYFEFWQGRTSRLHDRITYNSIDEEWKISRLEP